MTTTWKCFKIQIRNRFSRVSSFTLIVVVFRLCHLHSHVLQTSLSTGLTTLSHWLYENDNRMNEWLSCNKSFRFYQSLGSNTDNFVTRWAVLFLGQTHMHLTSSYWPYNKNEQLLNLGPQRKWVKCERVRVIFFLYKPLLGW